MFMIPIFIAGVYLYQFFFSILPKFEAVFHFCVFLYFWNALYLLILCPFKWSGSCSHFVRKCLRLFFLVPVHDWFLLILTKLSVGGCSQQWTHSLAIYDELNVKDYWLKLSNLHSSEAEMIRVSFEFQAMIFLFINVFTDLEKAILITQHDKKIQHLFYKGPLFSTSSLKNKAG